MELLQSNSGHYYYSEGRGNPIVFLHGFPDCPENYKDQLSFFASKGYQALVPYMPGYHPEDKDLDTYQSVRIAEDIIGFIESVTDQPIILIGHDWGSSVSYAIAGIRPDLVKRLISISVPHGLSVGTAFLSDAEQQRKSWYMFFFQLEIADIAVPFNNFNFIERLWTDWSPNWPEYKEYANATQIKIDSKKHLASNDGNGNKYGFILQNPKQLRIPIPCTGQLNFFEFKPELTKINEIKTELFEEEHRYMWINHH